ncbi:trypsin-like serine peptidase [Streptomyces sp. enrichment culture]|uniref:trypsin-like serine peptidase n=1 Tax=Streptomyces sp. enrichment culture TaxID=1795815 RepID=UPI003F55795A
MRSIRPSFTTRREGRARRRNSPMLGAVALASALALTATACESGDAAAGGEASASATASDDGKLRIPDDIRDRLREHGIDIDKWKNGAWKNWDRDDWLREAHEYINPIIEGLWNPDRMREAEEPDQGVDESDLSGDQGVTDPTPAPVRAQAVPPSYHAAAPTAGKVFFDSPKGSAVCSATVVKDPAHPGKSNLVWTAGHCVHAGKKGGWYRNIAFVPSYNDDGKPVQELENATREDVAPYGVWWGDWAQTSDQWIEQGGSTGGDGAPYDFAVIHVTPEKGSDGKSLEETVGSALPVDFKAPAVPQVESVTAIGYPAAPPYDGQKLYRCQDRPGRLSLTASDPTMYRIGCTMTGGSSGGGWVATGSDGRPALVSNTSIGPVTSGWLAGPRLGEVAKGVFDSVSEKYEGR